VTCILHNYLREQVIWEVLRMFEAILQKHQTKEEVPIKVLLNKREI
jgi:hypothetical protein